MTTIVWFRQDLRLSDNPALHEAAQLGDVLPLYILDETGDGYAQIGAASRWWLHHSLKALEKDLGGLVLRKGDPQEILLQLAENAGAERVFWNRCYEPHAIKRDKAIKAALSDVGVEVQSFNASLLHEPWEVETGSGEPYKVFTPFWRNIRTRDPGKPLQRPHKLDLASAKSDKLNDWTLTPSKPDWAKGWLDLWTPGENGARTRLDNFLRSRLKDYAADRDLPAEDATSRLSPHLHFGEISPRQIWARAHSTAEHHPELSKCADKFLSELAWRDFSYHLLYHWPTLPSKNWKSDFDDFPWRASSKDLDAWRKGQTGYPMVDAGMRELWATGVMHNRVRMIAASFLVKHLRIDWRKGAEWFWDTLVDADLANNAASWQWVAGSGADASPFFRIFNPITQGQKFDPKGDYVRKWCPELAKLDDKFLHEPWTASDEDLNAAGVKLGDTYPRPIVDHMTAREQALDAYRQIKN